MKPHEEPVHYAAPVSGANRVDESGNTLAPCDAIVSVNPAILGEFQQRRSTRNLKDVTCPVCRDRIAAIGAAYCKARRQKEISW